MTHQWKPGDRGRIEFEVDSSYPDGWTHVALKHPGGMWTTAISTKVLAEAEFVAPVMPKPGEWTGPGLTPIYDVCIGAVWRAVCGEAVEESSGRHFVFADGYGSISPTAINGWRRIGDSE